MSNFNNFLKITPPMAKSIGATTDQEFSDKFAAFLEAGTANALAHAKLQTDFAALQTSAGQTAAALVTATETISAQAGKITALETKLGNPSLLTEAKITELATTAAKAAGSKEAATALGATGNHPAAPASQAGAGAEKTTVEALNAAGKFDEAFAADANIQAEFITKESYSAFMRAKSRGQVGRDNVKK